MQPNRLVVTLNEDMEIGYYRNIQQVYLNSHLVNDFVVRPSFLLSPISNRPNHMQIKGGKQKKDNETSGAIASLVHWRLKCVAARLARVTEFKPTNDGVRSPLRVGSLTI